MNFVRLCGISFIFVSLTTFAGSYPAVLVFTPVNNQPSPSYDVVIDDKAEVKVVMKIGGDWSKHHLSYVVCGEPTIESEWLNGWTSWLMKIPKQISSSGLNVFVENLSLEEFASNSSFIIGRTPKQNDSWPAYETSSGCPTYDTILPWSPNYQEFSINLKVERGSAIPGKYNIKIPLKYAYEENKQFPSGAPSVGQLVSILEGSNESYIPLNLTVVSKCNFNTSPINLSHGTMTGQNADGNQTSPYNLNVTCTPGTSLSVKLLGTQKVSGKTDNYTQCGTGGMCELTFDNGKYDETMTIDNSKTLSIKSTYRLNDITKPVAESFEGSGVLQVLVN